MGGALGLAILASLAAARTSSLRDAGDRLPQALTGGYHTAFLVGAAFAILAAALGGALLRAGMPAAAEPAAQEPESVEMGA
jgi:hypothetical protein